MVSMGFLNSSLFHPKDNSVILFVPDFPHDTFMSISKFDMSNFVKLFVAFISEIFSDEDHLFTIPL